MNAERAFDLQQNRSVTAYTGTAGSAWSGTMRGLLTAHLANGEARLCAEAVSAQEALELARLLNLVLECKTPELRRDAKARQEIHELLELAELLPGRDNQNNWKKKLEWLKAQFEPEAKLSCDACWRKGFACPNAGTPCDLHEEHDSCSNCVKLDGCSHASTMTLCWYHERARAPVH